MSVGGAWVCIKVFARYVYVYELLVMLARVPLPLLIRRSKYEQVGESGMQEQ